LRNSDWTGSSSEGTTDPYGRTGRIVFDRAKDNMPTLLADVTIDAGEHTYGAFVTKEFGVDDISNIVSTRPHEKSP